MHSRQLFVLIFEGLSFLGFKTKTKQQLIDIATGLSINTTGTKESLLNNIAKCINEIMYQEYKSKHCCDIDIEALLIQMKKKNIPKNMEPMLKEVFTDCRKRISKKIEKINNNMNNSITNPMPSIGHVPNSAATKMPPPMMPGSPYNNSMYSFSPTVQNYNFMYPSYPMANYNPYSYYPWNYMGKPPYMSTNMYNQMMGMPHLNMPYDMSSMEPNLSLPSNPMNQPTNNSALRRQSRHSNPQTRFSQQKQSIKKTVEAESVPQSQAMVINNYIEQNNIALKGNQNFYRLNQVKSNRNKEVTEINEIEDKNKNKQLPNQQIRNPEKSHSQANNSQSQHLPNLATFQQNSNLSQSLNPNLAQKSPQIKIQCICNNGSKGTIIKCLHCPHYLHIQCLNMRHWSKQELQNFECPRCTLRKLDPLNQVKAIFLQEVINFKAKHQFIRDVRVDNYLNEISRENHIIQIRAIRLDGNSSYQISWPDFGSLKFFDKVIEFKPLQSNSSVKKRKQQTIIIDKNKVINSKTIPIKLQIKSTPKEMVRLHRIREEGFFIIGVYLIKKMSANQLIQKICSNKNLYITYEESKSKIHNHFKINEDIYLQKLSIRLIDPILLNKIRIPARGVFCQHPQCFSLDTFILMMSKLHHRNWKCPICSYRCYGIYKDTYTQEILQKTDPENEEVEFYPDGTYSILENKQDSQGESNLKIVKKQIIQQVIIDDDDDIQVLEKAPIITLRRISRQQIKAIPFIPRRLLPKQPDPRSINQIVTDIINKKRQQKRQAESRTADIKESQLQNTGTTQKQNNIIAPVQINTNKQEIIDEDPNLSNDKSKLQKQIENHQNIQTVICLEQNPVLQQNSPAPCETLNLNQKQGQNQNPSQNNVVELVEQANKGNEIQTNPVFDK